MPEIIAFIVAAALPAYGLRFKIGPLPSTALEIVLLASVIGLAYWIYIGKNAPRLSPARRLGKLFWIAFALIAVASVVGIFVAPNRLAAAGIARAYFWEPMIFFSLLVRARPEPKKIFNAVLYGFALNAFVIAGYAIFQYFFPQLIPATYAADHRVTSFYSYPNAIALYLAPLAPLFLSAAWSAPLAAFALVAIIFAKSAGGLIALLTAIFFIGLSFRKLRAWAIVAAIVAVAGLAFLPQLGGLREQVLMQDWSGRVHRIGWEESWAMLRDHPLFGAGLSGYPTAVRPYHTAQGVEIFQYPHNLFLALWSELGTLGLFGFILIFVWFFKTIITSPQTSPYQGEGAKESRSRAIRYKLLAAAMIAILIHGLVDVPYFKNDLAAMFWIFIALVAL